MRRIYLDYAASTPVDKEVLKAMRPYFDKVYGNPGSTHWFGQQAMAAVSDVRETIARALNARIDQVIFTGSATEANNLALRGVAALIHSEKQIANPPFRFIISEIEHQSVKETAELLAQEGLAEVVYLPVDKDGIVKAEKLKELLDVRTALVSVMLANSEIGTVQPIFEIAKIIRDFRKSTNPKILGSRTSIGSPTSGEDTYPLFHCDAVQGFQYIKCDVEEMGVDLLTLSAHKIYGPKGIGALYVRRRDLLEPIITGDPREYSLRSGTENVPYIVGFGKAVEITEKIRQKEVERVEGLRDYFWKEVKKIVKGVEINGYYKGPDSRKFKDLRLPNNLNVYFSGRPAADLCIELDIWGVAVSSGTACSARSIKPSYVIEALGGSKDRAYSSLRFTLGRPTTKVEIDEALKVFEKRFR